MEETTQPTPVLTESGQIYELSNLDELGLRINSLNKKAAHLKAPLPESECMCEHCNTGRLSQKFGEIAVKMNIDNKSLVGQLMSQAEQILQQNNHKKIPFRGIGTFIFQKNKAVLDYSAYEALSDEDKKEFYRNNAELFRKNETIELDKVQLNEIIIKQGGEIQFFEIKPESYTFRFKK